MCGYSNKTEDDHWTQLTSWRNGENKAL
jgi:hypothetical protein